MKVREISLLCLICTIATGCSSNLKTTGCQKTTFSNAASLGFLQTRNQIIRLEMGGKFSILELSGNPIALSLSKAEFQTGFPKLYEAFETAIAGSEAGDVIIDASMNTPRIRISEWHFLKQQSDEFTK